MMRWRQTLWPRDDFPVNAKEMVINPSFDRQQADINKHEKENEALNPLTV
jgi:hypothetical protein